MLSCPHCGSESYERYREPKKIDKLLVRRHRCRECNHIFATGQFVISEGLANGVLDRVAAAVVPLMKP